MTTTHMKLHDASYWTQCGLHLRTEARSRYTRCLLRIRPGVDARDLNDGPPPADCCELCRRTLPAPKVHLLAGRDTCGATRYACTPPQRPATQATQFRARVTCSACLVEHAPLFGRAA